MVVPVNENGAVKVVSQDPGKSADFVEIVKTPACPPCSATDYGHRQLYDRATQLER